MRTFKFIRGHYTTDKVFNTSEVQDNLFVLDSNGEDVGFDCVNDEAFQTKMVNLANERQTSVFRFRPRMFKITGALQPDSSYKFAPTCNEMNFENDIAIPENVRTAANEKLSTFTNDTDPANVNINIAEGNEPTEVKFTFGTKEFIKKMIFTLTGTVEERGYSLASGYKKDAHIKISDNEFSKKSYEGVFNNGTMQEKVKIVEKTVANDEYKIIPGDYGDELNIGVVAEKYTIPNGYFLNTDDSEADKNNAEYTFNEIENGGYSLWKNAETMAEYKNNNESVTLNGNYIIKDSSESFTYKNIVNAQSNVSNVTVYGPSDSGDTFMAFTNNEWLTVINVSYLTSTKPSSSTDVTFDKNCIDGLSFSKDAIGSLTPNTSTTNNCYYLTSTASDDVIKFAVLVSNGSYYPAWRVTDVTSTVELADDRYVLKYGKSLDDVEGLKKYKKHDNSSNYNIYDLTYDECKDLFVQARTLANVLNNEGCQTIEFNKEFSPISYIYKTKVNAPSKDGSIIKCDASTYENLYSVQGDKLVALSKIVNDLSENDPVKVYDDDMYNVIDSIVYKDSDDTRTYVTLDAESKEVPISRNNVNDSNILSPIITDGVFRQIKSYSINATE